MCSVCAEGRPERDVAETGREQRPALLDDVRRAPDDAELEHGCRREDGLDGVVFTAFEDERLDVCELFRVETVFEKRVP